MVRQAQWSPLYILTNTSHSLVAVWSHWHLMPVGLVTAVFVFRSQVSG